MNSQDRKLIIRMVFGVIKSVFGIQEKLRITAFSMLELDKNDVVKAGWFELRAKSGTYYKAKIEHYTITYLSKGNLNV